MRFRKVVEDDRSVLTQIAKNILEPLYGNQDKAINEWITGQGFKQAYVLVDDKDNILGLLVLKMDTAKTYIKISTFIVLEAYRGHPQISRMLLQKAMDVLKANNFLDLIVTVSKEREDAIGFFIRNGFNIVKRLPNKYREGDTELVFLKTP